MTDLSGTITSFGQPWLMSVFLALAVALLEAERWWTRWRRRRGRRVGALAYVLDALAIAGAVLAVASALALLVRGIVALALLIGELMGWASTQARANSGPLFAIVAGIALIAAGVAFVRNRLGRPGADPELSEPRPSIAGVPEGGHPGVVIVQPAFPQAPDQSTSAISQIPSIVVPSLVQTTVAPTVSAPRIITAQVDESTEAFPSLSMLGQNRRPYTPAAPPPSFLASAEQQVDKRRPRVRLALAALALVGLSVGGLIFRQPLAGLLLSLRPASGEVTAAALSQATAGPAPLATPVAATAVSAPTLVSRHVKSDALNLRVGPGTDQRVIAKLARGASVLLLGESLTVDGRTWVRVRAGEQEGWVSQDLLE
jgi:hypothetical protein